MVVRDVSSYIAVYDYGDIKLKGCFEIDKELHKNCGMRIVPIALKEYYVNNIPIETTIKNHKDIFDFCMELKIRSEDTSIYTKVINNESKKTQLGRITRYFISGKNGSLIKKDKIGKITQVHKGFGIEIFNKYYESEDYNIDYQFYINEANKIKNTIDNGQLSLF